MKTLENYSSEGLIFVGGFSIIFNNGVFIIPKIIRVTISTASRKKYLLNHF